MSNTLMKCGHVAQTMTIPEGKPYCFICDCGEAADQQPSLEGRMAKCFYYGHPVGRNNETYYPSMMAGNNCGSIVPSEYSLPFFASHPDAEHDEFYCGCHSWD